MPEQHDLRELEGVVIDNYIIDDLLGVGGQATVFLAHGKAFPSTKYALKIFGLQDAGAKSIDHGLAEARNQASIDHASVVRVYEPGIADVEFGGTPRRILYIPMQYSPLGSCEFDPPFASKQLRISDIQALIGLLDGLDIIHEHGVLHRNIMPANILKFQERHSGQDAIVLRITDFGIAKLLSAIGASSQGLDGLTPSYMAPEEVDRQFSEAADIYSMGATLFYILTGKEPIPGPVDRGDIYQWQNAHKSAVRPNATDYNPYCPPRLALLIMQMMGVDPTDRPDLKYCIQVLSDYIGTLEAKVLGFALPERLQTTLAADDHPIRYTPAFDKMFHPEIHLLCGTQPFVIRIQMAHPVITLYKRLIEYMARTISDSFCLYETYGAYDVHIFLWSDIDRMKSLREGIDRTCSGSKIEISEIVNINHLHTDQSKRTGHRTVVGALAVQEGIRIAGLDSSDYLVGDLPDSSSGMVQAFTHIEPVGSTSLDMSFLRVAITETVRRRLIELANCVDEVIDPDISEGNAGLSRRRFPRITLAELRPDPDARQIAFVSYVASDYKYVSEVATAITDLGENAVKTQTFVGTGRIVVQSDKILF